MGLIASCFFPDASVETVDEAPFEALYEQGFRVVLFDIDNTIVPHDAPADDHAVALFQRVRDAHLIPVLVSNNREERVQPFAEAVGAKYLCKADKPSKKGMQRAMQTGGGNKDNTFLIGDQLFTDIFAARRFGIRSVLTKPIHPKEKLQIVLKRFLEKPLLAWYRRQLRHRRYVTQGEHFFS